MVEAGEDREEGRTITEEEFPDELILSLTIPLMRSMEKDAMTTNINVAVVTPPKVLSPTKQKVSAALDSLGSALTAFTLPINRWSVYAASALIMLMTLAVAFDVLLRRLLGTTLPWVMEFEQFFMATVVFLSLAWTQYKGGHVVVDMLCERFSPTTRAITDSIGLSFGLALFVVVAMQHVVKIQNALASHETGIVLPWPLWPFYALIVFGSVMTALAIVAKMLTLQAELWRVSSNPGVGLLLLIVVAGSIIFLPAILNTLGIEMTMLKAGILGALLLMAIMFMGTPIAFAMGFIGLIGSCYLRDYSASIQIIQMTTFPTVGDYVFTVIPFFVGMGFLCFQADFSKNLFDAAYRLFGTMKGGLSIATVFGCAGFASICGDSMATAATMGSVAIPEMKKAKYNMGMACGSVAAGGTLGILIPPSIGFIVYGIITEQSIGKLFMSGIIPGLGLAAIFCVIIWVRCKLNPAEGPSGPATTMGQKLFGLIEIWPILILFFVVMGGIWLGFVSATEGGAVGFFTALIIGLVLKRFTWQKFLDAMVETMEVTAMIFAILLGVTILNYFIGMSELPLVMADWVKGLGIHRLFVFLLILGIYVMLGMIMNIIPMVMLTLPMLFPTITGLGFDPIWFGVIMVIMMEMGQITPPVGVNVYVISGVAKDVPMGNIFLGIAPFIAGQLLMIAMLYIWPEIATWLPSTMDVLEAIKDM